MNAKKFEMKDLEGFLPKFYITHKLESIMEYYLTNYGVDCLSLVKDDKIIAVVGITHYRPGVAELWCIPSVFVGIYKKEFFKSIKTLIEEYVLRTFQVHRLIIAIQSDWDHGKKWARLLGFQFESVMQAYGIDRKNHDCYVRLF